MPSVTPAPMRHLLRARHHGSGERRRVRFGSIAGGEGAATGGCAGAVRGHRERGYLPSSRGHHTPHHRPRLVLISISFSTLSALLFSLFSKDIECYCFTPCNC